MKPKIDNCTRMSSEAGVSNSVAQGNSLVDYNLRSDDFGFAELAAVKTTYDSLHADQGRAYIVEGNLEAEGPLVGDRWLPQQAFACDLFADPGFGFELHQILPRLHCLNQLGGSPHGNA